MKEQFARDFGAAVPAGSRPVLVLRRRGCGCRVAAVHRVDGALVMAGRRRILGVGTDGAVAELVPFLISDLEQESTPQDYGCRHGAGHLLDLDEVAARARAATRREALYVVA